MPGFSGTVTIEMQFLADVELTCEDCRGMRFKQEILDIKYKGKNIHEALQMTVREAILFFKDVPKLTSKLKVLDSRRPRLSAARPISDNTLGRRGPTCQTRFAPRSKNDLGNAVYL